MSVQQVEQPGNGQQWSRQKVDVEAFKDAPLGRRFCDLLPWRSDAKGGSIPFACQDRTNSKAACRFFSNPRVEEGDILDGHFAALRRRYDENEGPILLLQDRTVFTFQRRDPHAIGFTNVNSGRDTTGRLPPPCSSRHLDAFGPCCDPRWSSIGLGSG